VEKNTWEGAYELNSSTNNIYLIKSRGIRWVGHVAHMGDLRGKRPRVIWSRIGSGAGACELSNELSNSLKYRGVLIS
jgi:hypothetical protein